MTYLIYNYIMLAELLFLMSSQTMDRSASGRGEAAAVSDVHPPEIHQERNSYLDGWVIECHRYESVNKRVLNSCLDMLRLGS